MLHSNQENFKEEKLKFIFFEVTPALKSTNFSCFAIGESVSFFGSWMMQIASIWLVYQLTNSAVSVGVIGFANQAMGLIITPIAGVLLDRWNLRLVLLTTQLLFILLSSALTFLTVSDRITVEWIIVIGLFQGIVKAFDLPARQIILPRLIEKKADFTSAMAVHLLLMNTAKLFSPMIGGLLIAKAGVAPCFLINTISYLPLVSALLTIQMKPIIVNSLSKKLQIWKNLKEGFMYVYDFLPIKYVLILHILVCFMAMTHINLIPIFAKEILNGNAEIMGFLMTASAFGSIIACLFLILQKTVINLEKIIAISAAMLGLSLILFSRSTKLEFCLVLMFFIGMNNSLTFATINNFIQLVIINEDKRSRVTSIFSTGFLGILPFGNLFFGELSNDVGVANALLFSGTSCILGAYFFAKQLPTITKLVKPIYIQMGLIAEKA
ncbi:MAG: MFS transporter [Mojavia pulchra JT2-VF2]|jgi:MFS family permease|uniref:MFS transporter n=1 Tax=Mojavia pulchra JT2-VF2 TaxID=287848 RepID=A0A951Q193_9NOST|nr:MFS transporter [Mojavia pulchra JT2-VF2]